MLKQQLFDSEQKSDAIQSACEQYLKEEKELKERMQWLTDQLALEKMNRQTDVETLNKKITEWEIKYEEDVEAVKKEYNLLLTYTDIERQVNHKALKGLQDRIDFT